MDVVWIIVIVAVVAGCIPLSQYNAKKRHEKFLTQKSELTEDKVKDEWSVMIDGAGGRGDELLESIARNVEQQNLPHSQLAKRMMAIEGVEPHSFLVIKNEKFKGYEMLVGAYAYGNHLNAMWYLVYDSPEHTEMREAAAQGRRAHSSFNSKFETDAMARGYMPIERYSMGDKIEFKKYITVVYETVQKEVKGLMEDLKLDASKLNMATAKGFISFN
jgi:hypothetical protein